MPAARARPPFGVKTSRRSAPEMHAPAKIECSRSGRKCVATLSTKIIQARNEADQGPSLWKGDGEGGHPRAGLGSSRFLLNPFPKGADDERAQIFRLHP